MKGRPGSNIMSNHTLPGEDISVLTVSASVLQSLAPQNLVIRRADRFDGGGFSIYLSDFVQEDVERIQTVYDEVNAVYLKWLESHPEPDWQAVKQILLSFNDSRLINNIQLVGEATRQRSGINDLMRSVIHDIRGGGVSGFLGFIQLLQDNPDKEVYLRKAVFLARDHAKMMRNALPDLDPQRREEDESESAHFIDDFIAKLSRFHGRMYGRDVNVEIHCEFKGAISNRCLETSAIDRILYNILNNAARFTADGAVDIYVFPLNDAIVRWVVVNAIDPAHQTWLAENAGADMGALFDGGLTRGGQGIGLANCAEFISSCFGVHPADKAVQKGYIGAKADDERFFCWFHWPSASS